MVYFQPLQHPLYVLTRSSILRQCVSRAAMSASLTLGLIHLGRGWCVDFSLLLVLTFFVREVRMGVVVAQPRAVLVALPTN